MFQKGCAQNVVDILLEPIYAFGGITGVIIFIQVRYKVHLPIVTVHYTPGTTLREEPNQINVILQKKLPAAKLSAVCTVYKQ